MASARYTLNITPEDLKPEEEPVLTPQEKRSNWLHYHKWWLIGAACLLILIVWVIHDVNTKVDPDYTIAVVTVNPLPDEVLASLGTALEPYLEDMNGDGQTVVNVVHYSLDYNDAERNNQQDGQLKMASEIQMTTDLTNNTSILFLTDSFEGMEDNIGLFAYLDDPYDYPDDEGKTQYDRLSLRWSDSAFLSGLDLNTEVYDIRTEKTVAAEDFFADFRITMRTLYDPDNVELARIFANCVSLMNRIRSGV